MVPNRIPALFPRTRSERAELSLLPAGKAFLAEHESVQKPGVDKTHFHKDESCLPEGKQ